MNRATAVWLGIWIILAPLAAAAQEEGSPHHMTNKDGSLNMESCGVCHNEDLSLQRSKLETCTLCHPQTSHAGSDEHLRAGPPMVKRALEGAPKGSPALPLAEDGHIYCGTCHLFHDPAVSQEAWLAQAWLPPDKSMPGAVRQAVIDRWAALALKAGEKEPLGQFAAKGTRQLRLPVDQGQLCRQCHGALR